MSKFEREERYIVLKLKELTNDQICDLRDYFAEQAIKTKECVVVEPHWPNYEATWKAIQQIEEGTYNPEGDGWISVYAERKSHGELVDVFCEDKGVRITNCTRMNPNSEWREIFHHHTKGVIDDATHWRPIPQPHKGARVMSNEISILLDELHECQSELTDARDTAEIWKSEAVEFAKMAGIASGKCDELRDEAERLRGRVRELESQPVSVQLSELMRGLEMGPGMASMPPYIFYVMGKKIADQAKDATDSAILRKQADAVEAFGKGIVEGTAINDDMEDGDFCADDILVMSESEAQRLRAQADEVSKG